MKKNLRYVLGSTSLLAFAIPVISMVSCGNDTQKNATYDVIINTDAEFTWVGSNTAKSNEQYKGTIKYKDGYQFDSIVITIGGNKLADADFTLNTEKTELTIPANKITGKIVITISTKPIVKQFSVKIEKDDKMISGWTGAEKATENQEYKATIKYVDGYEFDSIEITIGTDKLAETDFTLNTEKTELTIPAKKITGDITIKITAKAKQSS